MSTTERNTAWVVWSGLALVILAVIAVPFVRSSAGALDRPLPVIGQLPDFHLTNQNNEVVSLASLRGKVWVADIIFTRCPGPCRAMTMRFADLQTALADEPSARLVSLTSDPEYDTPAVLKTYAGKFHADLSRWSFLTGNRSDLRTLAVHDFKFVVVDQKPEDRTVPEDLFIHSTWFALVDQQGRVRGWFDKDGRERAIFESDDDDAIARLKSAVRQLLREPTT